MNEIKLPSEFLTVKSSSGEAYGGNQSWSKRNYVKGYGCGVVACANVLLHTAERPAGDMSVDEYARYAKRLRHRYLPVIPKFGMNGLFMAIGFDLCLRIRHTGMRAHWGCLKKNIFSHIERMLSQDIPVVLSIGPNWPNLWGNHRLKMYFKNSDGYREAAATRAHYVTVTAMDDAYLEVSSWGKKYYVNKKEYLEYIKKHSNALFSSILVVRKKG